MSDDFIGIDYLPEVVTALEMQTQDAVIRLETDKDSTGRIFIENKETGAVSVFNPVFCRDHFKIISQHCDYYHDRAMAEERNRENEPEILGTPEERKKIQAEKGSMFKQPVSESMEAWVTK